MTRNAPLTDEVVARLERTVEARARLERARKAGKLRERRIDIARDPASSVETAVFSDDGPTEAHKRHAEFVRELIYERRPGSEAGELRTVTRKVDTVALLLRAGKLDDPARSAAWNARRREAALRAARGFRDDFDRAHLDPLAAADMARVPGMKSHASDQALDAIEAARRRVRAVLARLGGTAASPLGSPLASAAWFVLGAGHSLSDFARRQRWGRGAVMRRETAEALVIGALALIAA
jgi:hypothetical protein